MLGSDPLSHELLVLVAREFVRRQGLGRGLSEDRAVAGVIELIERGHIVVTHDPATGEYVFTPRSDA
ncbi:MAG TPA: hypothetical protein VK971_00470 [Thiohalobacter sp.]|nr:hypothetical protein [Thiohalobacter sp.]